MYQKKWDFSKFHKTRKYAPIWYPKEKHLFYKPIFWGFSKLIFNLELIFIAIRPNLTPNSKLAIFGGQIQY